MEHPKDVGDRSTLAIMVVLCELAYAVYVPFSEHNRCDLVIEADGVLSRVQCKTGRLRDGSIRFAVCSTYGHYKRPGNVRRDYRGQIDCFAVFCPETAGVYLIPIDDISTRSTAYLRHDPPKNAQRAKVRFAADYEIGRVAIGGLRAPSGA
jgi:2-polyprenyl-6-methoxyphenol hydroxylase-like FAD-dependent oxidoreductase